MGLRIQLDTTASCREELAVCQPAASDIAAKLTRAGCPQSDLPEALTILAAALVQEARLIREFNATNGGARES